MLIVSFIDGKIHIFSYFKIFASYGEWGFQSLLTCRQQLGGGDTVFACVNLDTAASIVIT